ncbi:MAG: thioredoxin [Oscillospiraceae bacterium]|nr:thioredoxin [Oscillospiraceae bacterium]
MKLAIPYFQGQVFQHFGHATQFQIYTVEDGRIASSVTLESPGGGHAAQAAFLLEQGVSAVLCGSIGTGAEEALLGAGITLCSGITGDADEAAARYLEGTLSYGEGANCEHHHEEEASSCGGCGGGCGSCGGGCGGCGSSQESDYVETRTFPDIVHLTAENFEDEVLQDPGLICIDFWATWCGPCKTMAPVFEEAHSEQPRVKFCKIDVDEQPELAQLFGIDSVPTTVLVQNHRTLTGFVGARDKNVLTEMIGRYLK